MASIKGLRDQLAALAGDQVTLVEDKTRPWSEKRGEFDEREKDIEALTKAARAISASDEFALMGGDRDQDPRNEAPVDVAKHFTSSDAFKQMAATDRTSRFSVSAPETKAATDPNLIGTQGRTQYGRVNELRLQRATVADLMSQGTLDSSTLTYWQQGTVEGAFTTVSEAAAKPALHLPSTTVTEPLSKIAGYTKISDEMREDAPFLETMIRNQLLLRLALVEETQILRGNGTPPNVSGIMDRAGLQTESATSEDDELDAIFRATTKIATATFFPADGVVVHPTDYQNWRLSRDGNEQYYGGGPFTGAYGNSGLQSQPGMWGLNTVVTTSQTLGVALVGAWQVGATLFRKGGIRVEATNSDQDDFIKNLITIRAEERIALAVWYPAAFVAVDLNGVS